MSEQPLVMERTLVLLKPDCFRRHVMGEILARFERKGLIVRAMKMLNVTPELSAKHYAEHLEKPFYPYLLAYITSAPVVAMILEGPEAVSCVRAMIGPTNGLKAAPGTIRGDYSQSGRENLVHASDSPESAAREMALYFAPEEICG